VSVYVEDRCTLHDLMNRLAKRFDHLRVSYRSRWARVNWSDLLSCRAVTVRER